ncbi:MAG: DNA replication and repair protein RecF [Prevotella sp.]|nr:DNA replication and repair protein RecF [Prevotella sp.]
MTLEQLSIINYKNITEATLSFSPKINCLVGHNGAGKTNVLDAIYFLSFCHSAFTVQDSLAVSHGKEFLMLEGKYRQQNETAMTADEMTVHCGMKVGQKKHFRRDGKEYKRLSEHIGLIPIVMVSPADTLLLSGGSEERRRQMDQVIAQTDRTYIDSLNRYNKALQQRNAMLRDESREPDLDVMTLWEEQMAAEGVNVAAFRHTFVEKIAPLLKQYYEAVSGGREKISISYVSHCQRGPLLEVIQRDRMKDCAVGYSLHGIHRDDLEILLNGHPMRREGSQGQQKSFAVSFKLAQHEYLREKNQGGNQPLLLLDDIFDKLDAQRVENIIDVVAGRQFGQIFITDTNRDHIDKILSHGQFDHNLFHVADGEVEKLGK